MADTENPPVQQLAELTATSITATVAAAAVCEAENPGSFEAMIHRETANLERHRAAEGIYG